MSLDYMGIGPSAVASVVGVRNAFWNHVGTHGRASLPRDRSAALALTLLPPEGSKLPAPDDNPFEVMR